MQVELLEFRLHFAKRSFAEAAHAEQIVFGALHQFSDAANLGGFEAVRRADAELKLSDRHTKLADDFIVLLVAGRDIFRHHRVAEFIELDEGVEVLAKNLRCFHQRHVGGDGAVGPQVEDQLLIVGLLTDASVLGREAHALHWREDRVDRNLADDLLALLGQLLGRGHVAAALLDGELDIEIDLVREGRDDLLRVDDFDGRVALDEFRSDVARTFGGETHGAWSFAIHRDDDALDVQDDVDDIFENAWNRREFVSHALDLDLGDRSALNRGEQHATKAVANGGAEAWLEWFRGETRKGARAALGIGNDVGGQFEPAPAKMHVLLLCPKWAPTVLGANAHQ